MQARGSLTGHIHESVISWSRVTRACTTQLSSIVYHARRHDGLRGCSWQWQESKRGRGKGHTLLSGCSHQLYCCPIGQSKSHGQTQSQRQKTLPRKVSRRLVNAVNLPQLYHYLNFSIKLKSFKTKSERNVVGLPRETEPTE